jgi:hypothetical protein
MNLAKTKLKNQELLNKKMTAISSSIPDMQNAVDSIIDDPDMPLSEKMVKLKSIEDKAIGYSKAYPELAGELGGVSGVAGEMYEQYNQTDMLTKQTEQRDATAEFLKSQSEGLGNRGMSYNPNTGSMQLSGQASTASTTPKYDKRAMSDIFGLGTDFMNDFQYKDSMLKIGAPVSVFSDDTIAKGKAIKNANPQIFEKMKQQKSSIPEDLQDDFDEVIRQIEGGSVSVPTPTGSGNIDEVDEESFLEGLSGSASGM